jgi:antitoxin (DNA-binding transcriptional repressor) of toxin-antitoxin stability system
MIDLSIMKKATVADLRNHFRKVSAWIENGEAVEITRRGRTFARLVPVEAPTKVPKVDFAAQRKEIWGTRFLSEKEIAEMRAAELGDRS